MRKWRKVHSNLIFSERAPMLSDSAMILFCLLVLVQDDEGFYPWTPQAVRSFTISRTWSFEQATELANELVAAGMAFWEEGAAGIVLHRGKELNGLPRKYSTVLSYRKRPIVANETPPDALGTEVDRRLPLADQRLPSDEDKDEDGDGEGDGDGDGDGETDSPSNLQGGILGHFSPQELVDLRESYPLLDLEIEAEKCLAWYRGKGEHIRDARAVFRKWLERARPPDRKIPPSKANHSRLPRDEPLWEKPPLAPSSEAEALWERCKALLKVKVTRPIFATWISPTKGFAVDGDVVWVQAKTTAAADTLDRRVVGLCEAALRDAGKPNAEMRLFVEPSLGVAAEDTIDVEGMV